MEKPHVSPPPRGVRAEDDYVEFWPAGTAAAGRFCCTACGNSVSVRSVLPRCMLCGERLWERAERSPFAGQAGG
jgi:hypothetical protein